MSAKMDGGILFGADPEVCLADASNHPVGAWRFTGGIKEAHERTADGLDVHADGVALEFNIPATNSRGFSDAITTNLNVLIKKATLRNFRVRTIPVVEGYSSEDMKHPLAIAAGCDPDFSAYADEPTAPRPAVYNPLGTRRRYFGGHLHIGYDKRFIPEYALVRCLEALTYLQVIARNMDNQGDRRRTFGLAGLYRPKSYGVEYRTPSNFWLNSPDFMNVWVGNAVGVFSALELAGSAVNAWYNSQPWADIKDTIDIAHPKSAGKLFEQVVTSWEKRVGIGVHRLKVAPL